MFVIAEVQEKKKLLIFFCTLFLFSTFFLFVFLIGIELNRLSRNETVPEDFDFIKKKNKKKTRVLLGHKNVYYLMVKLLIFCSFYFLIKKPKVFF